MAWLSRDLDSLFIVMADMCMNPFCIALWEWDRPALTPCNSWCDVAKLSSLCLHLSSVEEMDMFQSEPHYSWKDAHGEYFHGASLSFAFDFLGVPCLSSMSPFPGPNWNCIHLRFYKLRAKTPILSIAPEKYISHIYHYSLSKVCHICSCIHTDVPEGRSYTGRHC